MGLQSRYCRVDRFISQRLVWQKLARQTLSVALHVAVLRPLSLTDKCGPAFHLVSVGRSAGRNVISRAVCRCAAARLGVSTTRFPSDVRIGQRQAPQRRSELAQSARTSLPLHDPAAAESLGGYAYQSPAWLLDSLTFLALAIELVCPFLLFFPRRLRHFGAGLLIALQLAILLTGNYAFFNFLSIAICFWAFDDRSFDHLRPILKRSAGSLKSVAARTLATVVLSVLMFLGALQVAELFAPEFAQPFRTVLSLVGPWEVVNSYGLFAVMTTSRPEIILEGSNDGQTWKEYSFPYKPGPVNRGLPVVAPLQPRLDWQLCSPLSAAVTSRTPGQSISSYGYYRASRASCDCSIRLHSSRRPNTYVHRCTTTGSLLLKNAVRPEPSGTAASSVPIFLRYLSI